jgi:ferredoxin
MLAMLDDVISGEATPETLVLLEDLAKMVRVGSLCALGRTAPNPVLSTLRYFRDEIEAHVIDKRCPTGNCEALARYKVIPEKCKSCDLCKKACPIEGCISGERGVPYVIDPEKCINCGACFTACRLKAITKG